MAMKRLFELMAEKNASDIFVSVGAPIAIKINGSSIPVNQQIIKPDMVRGMMTEILTEKQLQEFDQSFELNTSYPIQGLGSFRISCFMQRTTPAMVVRFIPGNVPGFDTLNLPPVLKEIVLEKRGLVLMVGATGSGKSTSLAAMIDFRNEQMAGHIITIEDPIEFLFKHKKSIVNQRELGTDAQSYHVALRNALRQAPDVILIGEIRDREAMTMAIAYAQSGHLCLATLHANNAYHALNRIISFYPLENRPALLQDLSASLRCVVSQRLIRNTKGERTPAVEVMLNSRHIADLIEQGQVNEIKEAMEKSLSPGSQTFEQALFNMVREGRITKEEALANADSANNLMWLMNNSEAQPAAPPAPKLNVPHQAAEQAASGASFTEFKLDMSDEKAA
ncbi:MAG TPA: PilT/PilU family type 4a pilus ATPase [Burkholderiales bacterium]|nr:PilT/PilU family type 4a pilus ATPase [Burkholderiales bacterium]